MHESAAGGLLQLVHLPQELVLAHPAAQVKDVTAQSGLLQLVHLPQELVLAHPAGQVLSVALQSWFIEQEVQIPQEL